MAQRHRPALRFVIVGAVLALAAVVRGPGAAGTYTFSFQESIVDDRLDGPAVHGTFAALRDTSVAVAGWHGPRVRTTAGGHTAGSFAMLDLVAPSPAKFVQSSIVVRYRGCSKEAGAGFWMEVSVLVGQSEALGTRRTLPPFDALHGGAGRASRIGHDRAPRPRPVQARLDADRREPRRRHVPADQPDQRHHRGHHGAGGHRPDASGATTGAGRIVTWSAADGQAGPRSVTLRVTGPNGFVLAPAGWPGTTAAEPRVPLRAVHVRLPDVGVGRRLRRAAGRHRHVHRGRDGHRRCRQRRRAHASTCRASRAAGR